MLSRLLSRARGQTAETQALHLLQSAGLRLLARNWLARGGELDLVMRDGEALVFVEVRARHSGHFGGAVASITATKQRRLISAARQYLMKHPEYADCEARFDVVSFEASGAPQWLKAAFDTGDS